MQQYKTQSHYYYSYRTMVNKLFSLWRNSQDACTAKENLYLCNKCIQTVTVFIYIWLRILFLEPVDQIAVQHTADNS